jgi:hypothetical protein
MTNPFVRSQLKTEIELPELLNVKGASDTPSIFATIV